MSKPLEPGCKAIVTVTAESPENLSRLVRCVEELPPVFFFKGEFIDIPPASPCRLWMCESLGGPLVFRSLGQAHNVPARPFCSLRLQRLDDVPPDEVKDLYAPSPLLEKPTTPGAPHVPNPVSPLPVALDPWTGEPCRSCARGVGDVHALRPARS